MTIDEGNPGAEAVRVALVAPTFDHAAFLGDVLRGIEPLGLAAIVIDDGSRDQTASVLLRWAAGAPGRIVVTHGANRGKAEALRSGFREARVLGFTHAATIDTDGQHNPEDLRGLLTLSREHPRALIVGARPRRIEGYPFAGRLGRALSNHLVWVESGVRVNDSQSGLRVYPLALVDKLDVRAGRYAFETEALTRVGWAGARVLELPVSCVYRVAGGRVSHFRVWRDTVSAVAMHGRLLARSCLPGDPVLRRFDGGSAETGTLLHRAGRWFSPRRLVGMARGDAAERERLAASVAAGLFMATVPAYGVKTVVCLWLSARLRLHPLAVVGVSSLSTPPVGFVFVALSMLVGHLLLHGSRPDPAILPRWGGTGLSGAGRFVLEWVVGSIPTGAALALAGYGIVRAWLVCGVPWRTATTARSTHEEK